MPYLTKPYESFERPGLVVSYKLAAGAHIYKGAAVGLNSAGFLAPMNPDQAGMKFVGVASESADNASGANGAKSAGVTKSGSFVLKCDAAETAAADKLGAVVYATSDWECASVTTGVVNAYPLGTIVALETTSTGASGYRVRIDKHTV